MFKNDFQNGRTKFIFDAMIFSNKKVAPIVNSAQQMAKIIANVNQLLEKKIIRLEENTIYLYPTIWKDKPIALNWLSCLHHYYCVKRKLKSSETLYFKDIESDKLLGTVVNKKAKVLIFEESNH